MSNTNNTTKATRSTLLENARKAISVYTTIIKDGKALNEQTSKAKSAMDKAVSTLNEDMLSEIYDRVLSTPNPMSAFAKTNKYSKATSKLAKDGTVVFMTAPLSMPDFFEYAKKKGTPIMDEANLTGLISALLTKIKAIASVRLNSENEAGLEVSQAKCALDKVLKAINVEGVKARKIDAEYLYVALVNRRTMDDLSNISDNQVMLVLMDVFHHQITGKKYDFPAKEKKPAK